MIGIFPFWFYLNSWSVLPLLSDFFFQA